MTSTSNLHWVKALGCDKVIDYTKEDFTQNDGTYDVIFDAVRMLSESQSKRVLREGDVYLSTRSSTTEESEDLLFLKELVEAGNLKPVIDRRYSLEQIVEAHRYVEKGHKKGNVVITLDHKSET